MLESKEETLRGRMRCLKPPVKTPPPPETRIKGETDKSTNIIHPLSQLRIYCIRIEYFLRVGVFTCLLVKRLKYEWTDWVDLLLGDLCVYGWTIGIFPFRYFTPFQDGVSYSASLHNSLSGSIFLRLLLKETIQVIKYFFKTLMTRKFIQFWTKPR